MKMLVASLVIVFSIGCSTYNKRQCEEMSWNQQGLEQALKGRTKNQVMNHFERECKNEHGVQPNEQLLNIGYEQGLKRFCTTENMADYGRHGGKYQGHCPAETESKVIEVYKAGRIGFLEKQVDVLESQISSLKSKVSNLESEKSSIESRCH